MVKGSLFWGRVVLGAWYMWPSPSPKLWWSARKLPFSKWSARQPDRRAFLAKERSGVLHIRFKLCAILGITNTFFPFPSFFFNRGPKPFMVFEFRRADFQSVGLIGEMHRLNCVSTGQSAQFHEVVSTSPFMIEEALYQASLMQV